MRSTLTCNVVALLFKLYTLNFTPYTLHLPITYKNPHNSASYRDLYNQLAVNYLFKAVATSTAQATVHPTIGLLPIPRNPIISTCAGTDEEPAN